MRTVVIQGFQDGAVLWRHGLSCSVYARFLFIDYSSAFNTISPFKLHQKLLALNISRSVCDWTLDFLLDRTQCVRIGKNTSKFITINTGTPQGCKISPLLYSIFTHDCLSLYDNCMVVKFADDTTVAGLIRNSESEYRNQVSALVEWCSENDLELNVKKTKEIIVDFRRNPTEIVPLVINGSEVEIVQQFKFLGINISSDLKWEINTDQIVKKAQQRLYFMRRLRSFHVSQELLVKFYRAVIESVLTQSFTVWYGNTTVDDRRRLNRILRAASRVAGCNLPSLDSLYRDRVLKRATSILCDESHPAHDLFELMPSRARYRSITAISKRSFYSFYPTAVRTLNEC